MLATLLLPLLLWSGAPTQAPALAGGPPCTFGRDTPLPTTSTLQDQLKC
jgi:hypothetical protein